MKKGFLFFSIKFSPFKNTVNLYILFQLILLFYPDSILTDNDITYTFVLQVIKTNESIMPQKPYVFAQFLHLLPMYEFQSIVNKYNGDYRIKHFKCRDQLACMIFAHIRQEKSLRDIDIALNAHAGKLYHIGIKQCPKSTLADANERRDYRIYEEFAKSLMQRVRREYVQTQLAIDVDNTFMAPGSKLIQVGKSYWA